MKLKFVIFSAGIILALIASVFGLAEAPQKIEYAGTVSDIDGNVYKTVRIGKQIWMAENLRSTHYSDGTPVKSLDYGNDPSKVKIYGKLYTWAAAMRGASNSNTNPSKVQGIAPQGWHLPSRAEWQELMEFLGGGKVAGGKLKETGSVHWLAPNTGATDEYGFSALPAGCFDFGGKFQRQGDRCYFLTSSYPDPFDYDRAGILIRNDSAEMIIGGLHPDDAYSIRCVKD
jgi:uncharacterized protein (TIGR02145 family)